MLFPVSLALGQAIIESGWGQSRFATEGNAFMVSGLQVKIKESFLKTGMRIKLTQF